MVPSEEHIFLIKYHLGGFVVKEGNAKYRMGEGPANVT